MTLSFQTCSRSPPLTDHDHDQGDDLDAGDSYDNNDLYDDVVDEI